MIENKRLLLPYVAPYFSYVFIASVFQDVVSHEINYILRIIASGGLLYWARNWYLPIRGPKSISSSITTGTVFGIIGCILWIVLLIPFTSGENASPWSTTGFLLRLSTAGLLVPLFEELMIRGFAFRLAYQWYECRLQKVEDPLSTALHERSINDVEPGEWSWAAVVISTLVFMIGHAYAEWPAAIAYGLLISFLLIKQKDLLSCIIAHGVTNICLAVYVYTTNSWQLW